MYTLASITKFVSDKKLGAQKAAQVLDRAKNLSNNGVVSGGAIGEIMDDPDLAADYYAVAITPEHLAISQKAINASP